MNCVRSPPRAATQPQRCQDVYAHRTQGAKSIFSSSEKHDQSHRGPEDTMEPGSMPEKLLESDSGSGGGGEREDNSLAQVNLAFEEAPAGSSEGSTEDHSKREDEGTKDTKLEVQEGTTSIPTPSPTTPRATFDSLPSVNNNSPSQRHTRTASQLSLSDASYTAASEPDAGCGEETDGCTTSELNNRSTAYSEAATLPIGYPNVEEKMREWDGRSEEKHSAARGVQAGRCDGCCGCLLRVNHKLPEHPTATQRLKYSLTCPPHGKVGDILLWAVMALAGWGCLICITGREALPGGNLFSLAVLYVAAVLAARLASALTMPPLLGSLLAGILFESVPGINSVGHSVDVYWSAVIRNLVLVIILLRAGLGLDPEALRKLSCVVLRLALLPCVVEAAATAVVTKLLLGLPWLWSFMLGFIVAAVSPAVVVPGLLRLGEEGYGVEAGIPTLVIAAASLDDVLAITGFSVMLGLTFAEGSLVWTLAKGPLEVVAGLVYGAVFGALCWLLPHRESKDRPMYKFVLLFCLGALGMFGSHKVGLESSGPIAVLSLAFVTGLGWRRSSNWDTEVTVYYRVLWEVFQPALFVLIGAEIDVGRIDTGTIGWGLLALLVCLSLRVATSFLVVAGAGFSLLERLFIAIAWLPKATVQAAIGSQALDYVRQNDGSVEDIFRGEQIVTIAVMVILVTAPIGAAAIKLTGPKFLARRRPSDPQPLA